MRLVVAAFGQAAFAGLRYTGVFAPGKRSGLIRMGSAASYDNKGLTPGVGVKFPRTNRPSGNYVGLHSTALGA